ncbi:MAG TPA: sugar ABC transporter ATP-binding protein [Jatrophihabitans sp.]|jgi:ribose transport system ATP-binding protein
MDSDAMPAALDAAGIVKTFGTHRALDRVSLTVRAGEVHGLLGENGSGKSTIIKILSGFHRPDAGELRLAGVAVPLPLTPERSTALGLRFVHQDLGLIPALTVAENFALPQLSAAAARQMTSERSMSRRATDVLGRYDVHLDPRATIRSLSGVERAMLAIVRAIDGLDEAANATQQDAALARILVLDEPTVFLPRRDVERLFELVRGLAQRGCGVLLVSHDLDEIAEVTDRITVLRDGTLAGTAATGSLSRAEMVELIVGRQLTRTAPQSRSTADADGAALALRVEGLTGGQVRGVSFDVAAGEIVGLTGLAGAGFDEIPYLLYGAKRATSGSVALRRAPLVLHRLRPHRALRAGMVLLPADRRRTAGLLALDLNDNVTVPRLAAFRAWFGLRRRAMRRDSRSLLQRFDVRPPDPSRLFSTLSGGNQQKALLAKWLEVKPDVVLVDEPTQGVDVGARAQIFDLFREFTAQGRAVVCASTDHEQLALLTDRTLVLSRGRIVAELSGEALTKQRIAEACFESEPVTYDAPDYSPDREGAES